MKYDKLDFLEQFDDNEESQEISGWYDYFLKKDGDALKVSLYAPENKAYFDLNSVSFEIYNIKEIRCDKNLRGIIRFLFYKYGQEYPIIIMCISPYISVDIDIEQTGRY